MFDRFFAEPRGGRNWAQEIAGVLLVGLDGQEDWRPGGPNARWLEATLAASKARFIFVASHYPAYSSTTHGRLNGDGRINDPAGRAARDFLYPLMQKYRVTAYLTGHDHGYERSEPPGRVTTSITASGAGAGPYGVSADPKQNPYSVVQVRTNHHCLLMIDGDTCTLTAIGVDGTVLDTKTWQAR
jgi:tartrate-resistant acid phosphatase type 5